MFLFGGVGWMFWLPSVYPKRTRIVFQASIFGGGVVFVLGKVCFPKNAKVTIPLKKLMVLRIDLTTNMNHQPAFFLGCIGDLFLGYLLSSKSPRSPEWQPKHFEPLNNCLIKKIAQNVFKKFNLLVVRETMLQLLFVYHDIYLNIYIYIHIIYTQMMDPKGLESNSLE